MPHRYHFSRNDLLIMLLLSVGLVAAMIFGGVEWRVLILLMLWYLSTMLIPAIFGDALIRRFGENWGTILAYAPLWLSLLLGLTVKSWMPIFSLR